MSPTAIDRLDYSKAPPGYEISSQWFNDGDSPDAAGVGGCLPNEYWQQWQWVLESEDDCGDWFGEGDEEDKTDGPAAALADAWAHYKAHNDPPGSEVVGHAEGWAFGFLDESNEAVGSFATPEQARAAAWTWHDRRLALADRLAFGKLPSRGHEQGVADDWGSRGPLWPRGLTWSEEQVSEAERWLVDSTAAMPEVLGG